MIALGREEQPAGPGFVEARNRKAAPVSGFRAQVEGVADPVRPEHGQRVALVEVAVERQPALPVPPRATEAVRDPAGEVIGAPPLHEQLGSARVSRKCVAQRSFETGTDDSATFDPPTGGSTRVCPVSSKRSSRPPRVRVGPWRRARRSGRRTHDPAR